MKFISLLLINNIGFITKNKNYTIIQLIVNCEHFRDISVRVVKIVMGSFSDRPVVEDYKHSTIVNYDCKVHTDCRFLVETTLEL